MLRRLLCRLGLHQGEWRPRGLGIGPPTEWRCRACGREWLDWWD
jgi:hypothetical protein